LSSRKALPDEDDLELLCELLSKIGESFDKTATDDANKNNFNECFILLLELSKLKEISSRIKVKLELVIALRKNNWKARREDEGPCKKEDIHKKIANETSNKANGMLKGPFSPPQHQQPPPIRMMQRGKEPPMGQFNQPNEFRRTISAPGHIEPMKNESKVPSFQTGVIVKRTNSVAAVPVSPTTVNTNTIEIKQNVENDISDEKIEEKLKGMMSDYLTIDDMNEVLQPLQELPKRAIPRLIVLVLDKYVDCNKSDIQKKLYSLLDGIASKGIFSGLTKQIEDAITSWEPFQTLWDYVLENSKAPSLISNILKLLITFDACTKTAIQESIHNIRINIEKENDEYGPSLEDFDKLYNDLLSQLS
jgi:hypothetical protein